MGASGGLGEIISNFLPNALGTQAADASAQCLALEVSHLTVAKFFRLESLRDYIESATLTYTGLGST